MRERFVAGLSAYVRCCLVANSPLRSIVFVRRIHRTASNRRLTRVVIGVTSLCPSNSTFEFPRVSRAASDAILIDSIQIAWAARRHPWSTDFRAQSPEAAFAESACRVLAPYLVPNPSLLE
jgi:hypothetical protein